MPLSNAIIWQQKKWKQCFLWVETGYGCYVYFHPSGDFAYLMRPREGTIFKCQFNKTTNWLELPSIYVGNWNQGYNEGVGTNVRMGVDVAGHFCEK